MSLTFLKSRFSRTTDHDLHSGDYKKSAKINKGHHHIPYRPAWWVHSSWACSISSRASPPSRPLSGDAIYSCWASLFKIRKPKTRKRNRNRKWKYLGTSCPVLIVCGKNCFLLMYSFSLDDVEPYQPRNIINENDRSKYQSIWSHT